MTENENSSIGNISSEGEKMLESDQDSEFTSEVKKMKARQLDKGGSLKIIGNLSRRATAQARMMSPDVLGHFKSKFGSLI
jgi:hypothetical protein